ncbi:MAG: hypothetical protein NTX71_02855 [Candidatus Aureabacteria bacterium]|nr:hypothetical protein [Candidatus Auribacterota bacterium]
MEDEREQWYYKTSVLVIALLCVGPLALPLLWFNPRFRLATKILLSAAVLVATYYSIILMRQSIDNIMTYYRQIQEPFDVPARAVVTPR